MAAPKLTRRQRLEVLRLIAADYPNAVIYHRLAEMSENCEPLPDFGGEGGAGEEAAGRFPKISPAALAYYRTRYATDIERVRTERRDRALSSGLAIKAERVARLAEHADKLELLKWNPDANGRLWNERAWRQTLEDIALELGERGEPAGGDDIVKLIIGVELDRV